MKKQSNLSAAGRKLSLNKSTITNLSIAEMKRQVGGDKTKNNCYTKKCGGGFTTFYTMSGC